MFSPTHKVILILVLFFLNHGLASCEQSKCLKLPYRRGLLTLYKNEVNVPSDLKTSVKISDDGERVVVFEFGVPQEGHCFWDEQVCLTSQHAQKDESCQKYNNQSMWFKLPFHNYFRTYKVTSLLNDGANGDSHAKYNWTSAKKHCAILFQKEEGPTFCRDFEYALVLKEQESFATGTYDFKSVFIKPDCQLMQYVIGKWQPVESGDNKVEFSDEITQYYCHCEDWRSFELGVTSLFPSGYKAEKITSVEWVWDGRKMEVGDASEAMAVKTSWWETNAVLFVCKNGRGKMLIKGVFVIVMAIAVLDALILWLNIWLGIEVIEEEEEDEDF